VKPSTSRVLHALQGAGDRGLTTGQLDEIGGTRFGGRIMELRDMGYVISQSRVRQGMHRYVLERQDDLGPIVFDYCTGMYACCKEAA
jgi:hypothetical protein